MSAPASGRLWSRALDRLSLGGMALSVGLMLQPWWADGLAVGFFATAACILLQVIAAHRVAGAAP